MQNALQRPAFTMVFSLVTMALVIMACSKKDPYEDYYAIKTSDLTIQDDALEHKAEVKVIESGGTPDQNPEMDYFIPLTIVSLESLDTLYLLTTSTFDLKPEDNVRNFFSYNSMANKQYQSVSLEEDYPSISDYQPKDIQTVLIYKPYGDSMLQEYPVIRGILGKVNPDGSTTVNVIGLEDE